MPDRSSTQFFRALLLGVCLATTLAISACRVFDPSVRKYEALFEHQAMVIEPYSSKHTAQHGEGFAIMMKPDKAIRVGAPSSTEFLKLLEQQLAVERSRGKTYCPNGYNVMKMRQFMHWYTDIEVNCK